MTHSLSPELVRRTVRVLVVGCGGNGSAIAGGLPYLHQAMLVHGHCGGLDVTLMDGDVVSMTNCVRQPFSQADIGHSKAVVLISRLNLFWGLNWHAIPEHLSARTSVDRVDLVIGCVDTRAARKLIAEKVTGQQSNARYYLDLGNHSTGGQFVLGQPWNWVNRRSATRLRTVAELFPELIEPSLDDDGLPSCSAVDALRNQEPFVNATLANHALALLARLFRYGLIEYHGAFVNVAGQRVQPLAVDPIVWRRLRRRGKRATIGGAAVVHATSRA
ncbi:MAG: PRTRC system ThiF family protein [Acidobacteria bacterium]|nr:PRTRC system ThiF family protein [Acidobacteriota bacterium]